MANVLIQRQPSATLDLVDTLGSARQKIEKFLSTQSQPMTPLLIARSADLNENTVRRELQTMSKAGVVKKDMNHGYSLTNASDNATALTQAENNRSKMSLSVSNEPVQAAPSHLASPVMPKLTAKPSAYFVSLGGNFIVASSGNSETSNGKWCYPSST